MQSSGHSYSIVFFTVGFASHHNRDFLPACSESLQARISATRVRMDSIRADSGVGPGQFKLHIAVEDGSLILRGVSEHALPEGVYKVRLQIEEANTLGDCRRPT